MQIFSGQTTIALLTGGVIAFILIALGLHPLLAMAAGFLTGFFLSATLLSDIGERLEKWLTTYK